MNRCDKIIERYSKINEAKDYLGDSADLDDYQKFADKYKRDHDFSTMVDIKGDKVLLNKKGLKELRSSIKAFDGKITDKRIKGIEKGILGQAKKAVASVLSKFPDIKIKDVDLEAYVGTDYDDISSGSGTNVTVSYDGDDIMLDAGAFLGNDDAHGAMSDGFSSWEWLALLADEDSPWYDSSFVDAYIEDQASQAVEALADLDSQGDLEDNLNNFFAQF